MTRPPMTGRGQAAERAIAAFCALIPAELEARADRGESVAELRRYLGPLLGDDGGLSPLGAAGYAARLRPVVEAILAAPPGLKVLDAGCGYGTESLLFSRLGADVTAVELVPERAALAQSRLDFHAGRSPRPLRLRFVTANVLRFLRADRMFDLIWALEAISHIYPPEAFLSLARARLAPGGLLALSDPNRINPVAWTRAALIRGSVRHTPHRKFMDPETGTPVDYGREKIFSVYGITRLLRASGYSIDQVSVSGYLGTALVASPRRRPGVVSALLALQRAAGRIPGLRRLGSNYTLLARPSSASARLRS